MKRHDKEQKSNGTADRTTDAAKAKTPPALLGRGCRVGANSHSAKFLGSFFATSLRGTAFNSNDKGINQIEVVVWSLPVGGGVQII